ncbi:MAG: protein with peptidoglycan-binding domain protein [Rhodobacterales bacterium]|nr:MAG: protein with peptidoglycan-binding domain protein [Rhodobacterales bacterium]
MQEWLNLHGVGLVVDGDFGPITERQVKKFQTLKNIGQSGQVDQITFEKMTEPMNAVLSPGAQAGESFADCVVRIAKLHLQIHPMEIGGQNRGPWVRMYMNGNQGINWPWCAGFVTFLMKQASELLGDAMPIKGSFSCDSLAAQAKASGRFVKESNAIAAGLPDGSLFLVRRTSTDWTHVGMVLGATSGFFETIEGNTNDEGSHEGYEVCKRVRGYARKDFILL